MLRTLPNISLSMRWVLYVREGKFYQLTGYEALLLQSFPKEYADRVKETVFDRHLVIQAGNAMTENVINKLGNSLKEFYKEA